MKKLLASDLDGTLIYNNELNTLNRESVLRLKNSKNIFGVSTGRPYNGVKFLNEKYGIEPDFYVLLNGALILDKQLEELKHDKIKYDIVEELYNQYKDCKLFGIDQGYETSVLIGDSYYGWDNIHTRTIEDMKSRNSSLISIDFSNKSIDEIENICNIINSKYEDYVVSYRNSYFVDIVPKGCSKGNGVKLIAEKYNISIENVYTIGDSFNDVSMFDITKNSFSFHNCEENLKKHVNVIVDSVAECIDKYILGE